MEMQQQLMKKENDRIAQMEKDNPWEWLNETKNYRVDGPKIRHKPKHFVEVQLMEYDRTSFDGVWEDNKGVRFTIAGQGKEEGKEEGGVESKQLVMEDCTVCCLEVEGQTCHLEDSRFEARDGSLIGMGTRIRWSDGTVWFRQVEAVQPYHPKMIRSLSPVKALTDAPSAAPPSSRRDPAAAANALPAPVEAPKALPPIPPTSIEVEVVDKIRQNSMKVTVRFAATFRELKETIAEILGDASWSARARLVKKDCNGRLFRYEDDHAIGEVRKIFVIGAKLSH